MELSLPAIKLRANNYDIRFSSPPLKVLVITRLEDSVALMMASKSLCNHQFYLKCRYSVLSYVPLVLAEPSITYRCAILQ